MIKRVNHFKNPFGPVYGVLNSIFPDVPLINYLTALAGGRAPLQTGVNDRDRNPGNGNHGPLPALGYALQQAGGYHIAFNAKGGADILDNLGVLDYSPGTGELNPILVNLLITAREQLKAQGHYLGYRHFIFSQGVATAKTGSDPPYLDGQVQQMKAIKRLEQQLAANNELMKNRFDTVILQLELKSRQP